MPDEEFIDLMRKMAAQNHEETDEGDGADEQVELPPELGFSFLDAGEIPAEMRDVIASALANAGVMEVEPKKLLGELVMENYGVITVYDYGAELSVVIHQTNPMVRSQIDLRFPWLNGRRLFQQLASMMIEREKEVGMYDSVEKRIRVLDAIMAEKQDKISQGQELSWGDYYPSSDNIAEIERRLEAEDADEQ